MWLSVNKPLASPGLLSTQSCAVFPSCCLHQSHTVTAYSSCQGGLCLYHSALSCGHSHSADWNGLTSRLCGGGGWARTGPSPPGPFLCGLDLHPNHDADCVLKPERISVPRHALRTQDLRHPVPPRAERAEAEAEPQDDLHSGSPPQGRGHRGPK